MTRRPTLRLVTLLIIATTVVFGPASVNASINAEDIPILDARIYVEGDAGSDEDVGNQCSFLEFGPKVGEFAPRRNPRLVIHNEDGVISAVRELKQGEIAESKYFGGQKSCVFKFTEKIEASQFYTIFIAERAEIPVSLGELTANESFDIYLGRPVPR